MNTVFEIESEIKILSKKSDELNSEYSSLESEIEELSAELETIEHNISCIESQIDDLKKLSNEKQFEEIISIDKNDFESNLSKASLFVGYRTGTIFEDLISTTDSEIIFVDNTKAIRIKSEIPAESQNININRSNNETTKDRTQVNKILDLFNKCEYKNKAAVCENTQTISDTWLTKTHKGHDIYIFSIDGNYKSVEKSYMDKAKLIIGNHDMTVEIDTQDKNSPIVIKGNDVTMLIAPMFWDSETEKLMNSDKEKSK